MQSRSGGGASPRSCRTRRATFTGDGVTGRAECCFLRCFFLIKNDFGMIEINQFFFRFVQMKTSPKEFFARIEAWMPSQKLEE